MSNEAMWHNVLTMYAHDIRTRHGILDSIIQIDFNFAYSTQHAHDIRTRHGILDSIIEINWITFTSAFGVIKSFSAT